jgi:hypothetical protein
MAKPPAPKHDNSRAKALTMGQRSKPAKTKKAKS